MSPPRPERDPAVTEEEVEAFLRAHPGFLSERPDLYRALLPPVRVHGEALADHMEAMIRAERAHAAAMVRRADGVLAAGRASAGLAARVQEAVVALIRAENPVECVAAEFPVLLAVDAAALCAEGELNGARLLPAGSVAKLLGARPVVFRRASPDAHWLHVEAAKLARHDALVRIPGEGAEALLALVARDEHVLDPVQGTGALAFLGRALAAALGR